MVGEPTAIGNVGGSEFTKLRCACGFGEDGGIDDGFVEVGEGGEQRGGKPGGFAHRMKITVLGKEFGIGGELTAEQFESEWGGHGSAGSDEVGERSETDVDVAGG